MKKPKLLLVLSIFLLGIAIVLSACKKDEEENKSPTVSSVTVNPASVTAGAVATVTVVASDPDGDALTYAYTATGGAVQGAGNVATWTSANTAGAYSVTVLVSDGNGGTASGSGVLTVTDVPQETKVIGTAQFPAGTSGDLSNAKVSLYTTLENWNINQPIKYAAVTGAGASVTFEITDVLPGNYYLDVWKDIDNSATWSINDYVGWYGSGGLGSPSLTQFQVTQGGTFSCSVNMYILTKKSEIPK
ncbi:MAG: hypothetical protein U9R60_02070 [Bacteroidota bacterium]|nr:hypothetical protein [Bacteroidota bacterium]